MAYVGINLGLWFIYLAWNAEEQPWPLLVSLVWGTVVFAHGATVLLGSGLIEGMKDQEIEREIVQEQMRLGVYDGKRKNDENSKVKNEEAPQMRLSSDGELIPIDEKDEKAELLSATRTSR